MAVTDLNRLKEIFAESLPLSSAERQAFLDRACAGDAELRAEVEEYLAATEKEGVILGTNISEMATSHTPLVERPGSKIGRYKLLEQIGEGGFGVVFMAEQEHPVRRRVALKIIKLGMDTKQVVARFEAERQALAMMDHPSIAKVFDAGSTDTGRPYFVMELVKGIPITEYCDQQRFIPRQRLELFIQVCAAVQHAHQKGIIHRDLKPSNVLVTLADDGKPTPKVIDFGIVKATAGQRLTDRTLFTEFRQLIGTPLYMSPEQAEMSQLLDVDTRSDIYSLGVLLYELLTGTTPFDKQRLAKAAYDEVRRIIREEDPPRPSTRLSTLGETLATISARRNLDPKTLSQAMRGELDWIVMKALEKDRTRRYVTANELAMDIQRHLGDEPVQACPPSVTYRFRKFARRNKSPLIAALLIALALVAGTVFSTWQAVRASRATRQAEAALAREEKLRQEAEGRGSVAKALNLCAAREFAQAEKLMNDIPPLYIELEPKTAAMVFRALGNWNGGEQRWQQAAADFEMLFYGPAQRGQDHGHDSLSMDYLTYAPVLVEMGDTTGYEKLRRSAVLTIAYDGHYSERMLNAFLLSSADDGNTVTPIRWGELAETSKTAPQWMCWNYVSLALFEYRRHDAAQAMEWAQKCLDNSPPPTCNARAHVILAMAYSQLNKAKEAQAELGECREKIDGRFNRHLGEGTYESGFWKDWLIDRILLREAIELIEADSSTTRP